MEVEGVEFVLRIILVFFILAFNATLVGLVYPEISNYLKRLRWAKYLSMEKKVRRC